MRRLGHSYKHVMKQQTIYMIGGPTASGKSALALQVAEKLKERGASPVIVNADSMQVYKEMPVLTAQPSAEDKQTFPHYLYGHTPVSQHYSVQRWLEDIQALLPALWAQGHTPVVVGGTGLYFTTLLEGLHPIPDIPAEVRARGQTLLEEIGYGQFHVTLAQRDAETASRLKTHDTQRLLRAWEVVEHTGTPLSVWHQAPKKPLFPEAISTGIWLNPPREKLYDNCNRRFLLILQQGALEEVEQVMQLHLPEASPALKALGYIELAAHLRAEIPLMNAIPTAQQMTRNYAKRQITWFKHQLPMLKEISTAEEGIKALFN